MIQLPAPHSPVQEAIILDPASSVNLCGRQYGKTEAGAERITRFGLIEPGLYWWVGYDWSSASMRRAWSLLKGYTRMIYKALGKSEEFAGNCIKESAKILLWPHGTEIWLRTAEHPESLSGEAINGVVCDEFTLWGPKVWEEFLEATTLIKHGWACFIGIPKGDGNWGCKLYEDVVAGKRRGWIARRAMTEQNLLVDPEWLDNIRRNTPDWLFRQEYEASIERGVGAAFPGSIVSAAIDRNIFERPAIEKVQYMAFVDAAGGGACEYTLAVFHKEDKQLIHDAIAAEIATNPEQTTDKFSQIVKRYGVRGVTGDAYSAGWVKEQWRKRGIEYTTCAITASDLYIEFQPLIKQGLVRLLDDHPTEMQFQNLVHKKASTTGKDQIVSVPGEMVDRVNAIAGAAVITHQQAIGHLLTKHTKTLDTRRTTGVSFEEMYKAGRRSSAMMNEALRSSMRMPK